MTQPTENMTNLMRRSVETTTLTVLVFLLFLGQISHILWLKTLQIYFLLCLEVEVRNESYMSATKVLEELVP